MTTTITISKSELSSRLISVSKIISSKTTLPIMENILLDIQDGTISITAADHQGSINTSIEGILTDNNISVCIEPKLIIEALKTLPEQPITITIDDNLGIIVKYKGGKFELTGKAPDEFPKEKSVSDAIKLTLPSKVLLSGIEKTSFCSANDELRPIMNGVHFDISKGQLNFVRIEYKSDKFVATLLEGKYPNYRSVIPQNNDKNLRIGVSEFKGAIKRVSVFSNQASSLVKLQLTNNQIMISGQDIDYSVAAEETIACDYSDNPITIGLKGHFLTELISSIPTSDLQISFSDPSKASLITPVDDKSTDKLTYLLMPMMLNN